MRDYFSQLMHSARTANHRFGVVLKGDELWQKQTLSTIKDLYAGANIFQLGGDLCVDSDQRYCVSYKHGLRLLGQECSLLVCDLSSEFDASSFSAVLGCVKGGGVVVILPPPSDSASLATQWLNSALERLICIEQAQSFPSLPLVEKIESTPFLQQNIAVEKIRKVVEGHRKRPLVLTADRGRGKSSALGIAAAELMQTRTLRILVTAPSLATVTPVFEHAQRLLPSASLSKGNLRYNASSLTFIAPDELIRQEPKCDFLLVDEASAIPIPMLKKMVERHHRCVFSTTIHGYEGCGRGFTLKFQQWLKQQRAGTAFYHLEQPIRWSKDDPLENWLFDTFLLNAELTPTETVLSSDVKLSKIDKTQLISNPELLRTCFALLVNAHYQTSPNDLMLLLEDEAIQLFAAFNHGDCLGCMLTVCEGELEPTLIESIQQGNRRPKGHLVPVMLANQIGVGEAARQASLRIMRIATHPDYQQQGIGSSMVEQLSLGSDAAFISTSFGATSELLQFWFKNGFTAVKLGIQRDQASGCHSVVMIKGQPIWLQIAENHFEQSMPYLLGEAFNDIETDIVRNLLRKEDASDEFGGFFELIARYCKGGAGYECVAPFIANMLLASNTALQNSSDLMIRKLLQQRSWQECGDEFSLSGRKQTEQQLRIDIQVMLDLMTV
ncbi:tRNA(Met) cytidine acetyltransferase TmcA [Vibrio neptunius]|uniref:tRNA(Met) cytidine acetyltransferase TmcA n=1 Tax=Vibrio neptunius TaxID=170651 RepID=UPI0019D2C75D|nr:GNAT family N-acetyltransferase [Vibrio neptunius]MBN3573727.1 tRNA(Met) cytidine acetyltransferase [Vibrio neptunius]